VVRYTDQLCEPAARHPCHREGRNWRSGFQNGLHGVGPISGFNAARDRCVGGIEAYYAGGMEAYNDARIQSAV